MALVVEDGTGLSTAESYNSVAAITTYNTLHDNVAAWGTATTDQQERSARRAAQYMDARYMARLKGQRLTTSQLLCLPREGIEVDGIVLDAAPLPRAWLEAHCELSIKGVSESLIPDVTNPGTIASESKTLDTLSKSVSYVGGKSQLKWYRLADSLVAPLLSASNVLERA